MTVARSRCSSSTSATRRFWNLDQSLDERRHVRRIARFGIAERVAHRAPCPPLFDLQLTAVLLVLAGERGELTHLLIVEANALPHESSEAAPNLSLESGASRRIGHAIQRRGGRTLRPCPTGAGDQRDRDDQSVPGNHSLPRMEGSSTSASAGVTASSRSSSSMSVVRSPSLRSARGSPISSSAAAGAAATTAPAEPRRRYPETPPRPSSAGTPPPKRNRRPIRPRPRDAPRAHARRVPRTSARDTARWQARCATRRSGRQRALPDATQQLELRAARRARLDMPPRLRALATRQAVVQQVRQRAHASRHSSNHSFTNSLTACIALW